MPAAQININLELLAKQMAKSAPDLLIKPKKVLFVHKASAGCIVEYQDGTRIKMRLTPESAIKRLNNYLMRKGVRKRKNFRMKSKQPRSFYRKIDPLCVWY